MGEMALGKSWKQAQFIYQILNNMTKEQIQRQMIAKLNNCISAGIYCSYRTVLDIEYEAAIDRENHVKAHLILQLINDDINS
jgi:hypothetical protein